MKSIVRLSICLLLLTISFGAPSALAVNKVLSLDGEGYVSFSDSSLPSGNNARTLSAWVKTTDTSSVRSVVEWGTRKQNMRSGMLVLSDERIKFVGESNDVTSSSAIQTNEWNFVVITYDTSNVKIYINGVLDKTESITNLNTVLSSGRIGINLDGEEPFNGTIDEVRIWNYARTQEEIRLDMNQPIENPGLLDNLVGYWNFDNGTAEDLSQYGNDGKLQGDATIVEAERAKVIFVPGDYPTIQEAIDTANPGDTVVVDPGTYPENITISKDSITLQGSDAYVTTIDGGGIGSVIKMSGANDITISGFTITNGLGDGQDYQGNGNGGGIAVSGCSNIVIRDNIITQNRVEGVIADGGGILISKCTAPITIWQNSITDNQAENWGGGICIQGTFDVRIDANEISNNDAGVGDGISLWEGGLAEGASAWVINNRIANNQGDGIYISDNCSALIGGNRDNDNDIFGNTEYAVRNDSTNTIDATYNYWGTTIEVEIRADIWDYYDDNSNGIVNYEPWLDGTHRRVFPFAQALSLDGDEDYVKIAPNPIFDNLSSVTVECWIRVTSVAAENTHFIDGDYGDSFLFRIMSGSGYANFMLKDMSWVEGTTDLKDGNWHHVAGIRDTNTQKIEIYVDGIKEAESTDEVTDLLSSVDGIHIGIRKDINPRTSHQGLIDEVRIWNIARTQEDIRKDMNQPIENPELLSNLVGYWNFDDSTANDSSPNGNHGTLTGDAEIIPLVGTWPPPKRGDVSGNGQITAYDAALILQYVVGLIDVFPADSMGSPSAIESHDYQCSLPNVETHACEKIQVPIAINDATGLLAGGIAIKYDPTVLRAIGYGSLELLNGYYWKANTNLPGEVRFAFATTEVVTTVGQGNLLMAEFEVLPNTEGKTSSLIFENVNFSNSRSITKINGEVRVIPSNFALLQNFPNPFNPDTWLPYKLASASPVSISIYNAKGQFIRMLHLGCQNAGVYMTRGKTAHWDGKDNVGEKVGSGVYFYTLRAGEFRSIRKMVIVK